MQYTICTLHAFPPNLCSSTIQLDVGPVSIVEMLFCTSLVAIVGTADSGPSASPRRLQIVNTKVNTLAG